MLVGLQFHAVLLDPGGPPAGRHRAERGLSAEHRARLGGEAAPEPHQRRRAGAQSGPCGRRAAAAAGHYESAEYGGGAARSERVEIRAVVVWHAFLDLLSGRLHLDDLLLSEWRGARRAGAELERVYDAARLRTAVGSATAVRVLGGRLCDGCRDGSTTAGSGDDGICVDNDHHADDDATTTRQRVRVGLVRYYYYPRL